MRNSCDGLYKPHQERNIYHLALSRKSLLIPGLEHVIYPLQQLCTAFYPSFITHFSKTSDGYLQGSQLPLHWKVKS